MLTSLDGALVPYPLVTDPVQDVLWRALVRAYNTHDPIRSTISATLRWGEQGFVVLALEGTTASFLSFPDDTDATVAIISENHILLIHQVDKTPYAWPALISIQDHSRLFWDYIAAQEPPSFDFSQGPLAFLADLTPKAAMPRWLLRGNLTENADLKRLGKGLAALISLHTQGYGTVGIMSRHWKADGTASPAMPWIILNGKNAETPTFHEDINTLLWHLRDTIALEDQTVVDWDQAQHRARHSLTGAHPLHTIHQGGHAHLELINWTKAYLDELGINRPEAWFTP